MIRLRHKMLIRALRGFDQLILIGTALFVIYAPPGLIGSPGTPKPGIPSPLHDTVGMLVLAIGWLGIFDYCLRYKADRLVALRVQLKDLLKATTAASFWFLIVTVIFNVRSVKPAEILAFWGIVTLLGVASRFGFRGVLLSARRSGYNYRYLLIVGANGHATELAEKVRLRPELGYKLVGFVAESEEARREWEQSPDIENVLGTVDDLRGILERERVDEILVCMSLESKFRMVKDTVAAARELGIVLRIVPDPAEGMLLRKLHVEEFENEYVLTLFREQLLLQLLVKRVVDIVISLALLILISPLMILVALLIKLTSQGPVLFVQDRVGMNQRRFRLYKFRSMVQDADERKGELAHLNERDGPAFKIADDPRITAIGRFIRRTSIDELPQLFNVVKGEMSLVGPRPPLSDEVRRYEWLFRKRLSVKPGITCVWQVSGRNNISFERWMEMDHDYIENWSLWLDLKILLKTVPAVLFGRGAS